MQCKTKKDNYITKASAARAGLIYQILLLLSLQCLYLSKFFSGDRLRGRACERMSEAGGAKKQKNIVLIKSKGKEERYAQYQRQHGTGTRASSVQGSGSGCYTVHGSLTRGYGNPALRAK
jgi:hypothetical protein